MFSAQPAASPSTAASAPAHVIDVGLDQFQTEVLDRSRSTPVLLDFWAEWCGPCKQLGPMLEQLSEQYGGAFILAKVNVDAEQELAGHFGIRSIPTVVLVKDGQLTDGFSGVLPPAKLHEFLSKHGIEPAPDAGEDEALELEAAASSPAELVAQLRQQLEAQPEDDSLKLDLALALIRDEQPEAAHPLLEALPANLETDDRNLQAQVLLAQQEQLAGAPSKAELEKRLAADPSDLEARHLLGLHFLAGQQPEKALEQFLEMLRQDRDFQDGLPRKALIDAFKVISDDALVSRYRREMSALLF